MYEDKIKKILELMDVLNKEKPTPSLDDEQSSLPSVQIRTLVKDILYENGNLVLNREKVLLFRENGITLSVEYFSMADKRYVCVMKDGIGIMIDEFKP